LTIETDIWDVVERRERGRGPLVGTIHLHPKLRLQMEHAPVENIDRVAHYCGGSSPPAQRTRRPSIGRVSHSSLSAVTGSSLVTQR
jgi:hypothetical protein